MLAVFGRLHADRDLNALVFGESVMNDAVAIVLYQVISNFRHHPVSLVSVLYGLWQFFYIFAGSLAIGVAVACVAALLFRTQYFRNEHAPVEAGLVIILAYCSFYLCEGLGCALLFKLTVLMAVIPGDAAICYTCIICNLSFSMQAVGNSVHHVLWHGDGQVCATKPFPQHR